MKTYILALAVMIMTAGFAQAEVNSPERQSDAVRETLRIEAPKASDCLAVGVGTQYKVEIAILEYEIIESAEVAVPVEFKGENMEARTLYASAGHMATREIYNVNNDYAFDVEVVSCDIPENAQASDGRLG